MLITYSFRSREVAEVEAEGGAMAVEGGPKTVEGGPKTTVLEDNLLLMVSTKHLYFLFLFL